MSDEKKELKPLIPEQQMIIDHYLKNWNQTKAYQLVHPKVSDTVARVLASRLFANDNFQAHIQARLKESHMSADEALQNMADMARGDIADMLDDSGCFDFEKARREGKTKLLRKIKRKIRTDKDGSVTEEVEFEMYDAQSANDKILRVHGKYQDNLDIKSNGKELQPVTIIEVIKSNE